MKANQNNLEEGLHKSPNITNGQAKQQQWKEQAKGAISQGQSLNDFVSNCHQDNRRAARKSYSDKLKELWDDKINPPLDVSPHDYPCPSCGQQLPQYNEGIHICSKTRRNAI